MEKIKKIKRLILREKIDGYFIPKNDEFFGEYVSHYNDRLKFISNFSGSYGFSLILKNKNYLFVDGRYNLQAKYESGKFFNIIKLEKKLPLEIQNKKIKIGFDPKLITRKTLNFFFNNKNCIPQPLEQNLIDVIWKRKVYNNKKKFYFLPKQSIGQDFRIKIKKVVKYLRKIGADYLFITASENNAWLLNIRGKDTKFSPTPHCYILIDKNENIKFFCSLEKITSSFKKKFHKIKFFQISDLNKILSSISKKKFIIDRHTCSYYFEDVITKKNYVLNFQDPIYDFKSVKNNIEIRNIKKAHIYDGAALTKYLFWLRRNFEKRKITEISAAKKLYEFRKKNNCFKFLSFPTISGSGPNGAIIHYNATKKTNRILNKGDIYLVDSGGQYEFGTTDVTRTISLKNYNKRIKKIFTTVLKGHIAVTNFKLKKDTTGSSIDKKARKYLQQKNLDYAHGTGHGVGYFLNVHEGPHAISKNNKIVFKEGMIVSNEPGYYEKNRFGIRIENLIYVKKDKKKLIFDNLTMAPIDKNLIDLNMLSTNEKLWLNSYHKKVFESLKKLMNFNEKNELKKACSAV